MELLHFDEAPEALLRAVDDGLTQHNAAAAPLDEVRPLSCFLRSPEGAVLGGAVGRTWGACAELLQLWVSPAQRGHGLGSQLLRAFEADARARGCHVFYLDTFSFQAPAFYRRHGYHAAVEITGYHGDIRKCLMQRLEAPAATARIEEGPRPGCVLRIVALHTGYYVPTHGFGLLFEAKVAAGLGAFCQRYRAGVDGLWLALLGDSIEGSVAIDAGESPGGPATLRWFITAPALRGQGAGRRLLRQALAFADGQGYPSVSLSTFAGLDAARHLYEAEGFVLAHQVPGSSWGVPVQEQTFVRPRPAGVLKGR